MLRPRKKYTVFDLQQLKGKRFLTHIHVKSPEEAAAAEEAGVDLMSSSFDSPEAQARLATLVAAAPHSFLSCATPHGRASPEEAIRVAFRALEIGASSVYCSASPFIIEAMARERIPVVGHLGMAPRHVTWTGYRAIDRTVEEATQLYHRMKELENAGAYAAELEVVPHNLARFLSAQTPNAPHVAGLRPRLRHAVPLLRRHPRRLRRTPAAPRQSLPPRRRCTGQVGAGVFGRANFAAEHRRLQQERLAAFREYIADVHEGRFPERSHLVEMEAVLLDEVVRSIDGIVPHPQD